MGYVTVVDRKCKMGSRCELLLETGTSPKEGSTALQPATLTHWLPFATVGVFRAVVLGRAVRVEVLSAVIGAYFR